MNLVKFCKFKEGTRLAALGLVLLPLSQAATVEDQQAAAPTEQTSPAPKASNDQPTGGTEGNRWLDLNTASFSYRYRSMADSDGYRLFTSGQERALINGRLKLDAEGKYSINFHASTGRNFDWSFADSIGVSPVDTSVKASARWHPSQLQRFLGARPADPTVVNYTSRGWALKLRELYFAATPIKQLSFEYGSLGLERGVNSEITSYDEDGYIAGERLRVMDPKHLFFNQIAVTYGYVGDFFEPNFFNRGNRLTQSNYHQFLVAKDFGKRLKTSVDYTALNNTDVMREAALVRMPETKVLDSVRVELYQRFNSVNLQKAVFGTGAGYAFTGSKTIAKKFQLEGGYASIDQHYTVLAGSRYMDAVAFTINGDAYSIGSRLFTKVNYKINPYMSLFGFYTHQVATDFYNKNREGMNFGMTVDFKSLLNTKTRLKFTSSDKRS